MDDPENINKENEYLLDEEEYPTQEQLNENNENKIELQVTEELPLSTPPPPPPIDSIPIQQNPTTEQIINMSVPQVQNELTINYVNNPDIVPSNQPEILINPEKPYYEIENKENNNIIQNQNENLNNREPEDKRCCCTRCCCCICGCIENCLSSCCDCIEYCCDCKCCSEECSENCAKCCKCFGEFCEVFLAFLECLAAIAQICAAFK